MAKWPEIPKGTPAAEVAKSVPVSAPTETKPAPVVKKES